MPGTAEKKHFDPNESSYDGDRCQRGETGLIEGTEMTAHTHTHTHAHARTHTHTHTHAHTHTEGRLA